MRTTENLPVSACPVCGNKNDCASSIEGNHVPTPGDISICINCGMILKFNDKLETVKLTDEEMRELKGSSSWNEIIKALTVIDKLIDIRRKK